MATSVWTLPEVRAWKKSAEARQIEVREMLFGDREYDLFELTHYDKGLLRKKISYAVFGLPTVQNSSLNDDNEKKLTKIFDFICKKNEGQNSIRISFLGIECLTRENGFVANVIRLHLTDDATKLSKSVYIDNVPRSYEDFNDYLDNNKLPKCLMCYPASGSYYLHPDEEAAIDFRKSPACDIMKAVLKGTDATSAVAGLGVTGLGFASFFAAPLAIPGVAVGALVAGGSSALYAAGRSISKLHDRSTHGQTLSLRSPEARQCWFVIAGTVAVVVGAGAATSLGQAAESGVLISEAVAKVPIIFSTSAGALVVINNVANIIHKYMNGGNIDATDIAYLVASIFLFTNIIMTAFEAEVIMKEMTQKSVNPAEFYKKLSASYRKTSALGELAQCNAVYSMASLGILCNPAPKKEDFLASFQSICRLISENSQRIPAAYAAAFARDISSALEEFRFRFVNEMECVAKWFCKIRGHESLGDVFYQISQPESLDVIYILLTMVGWIFYHALPKCVEQRNVGRNEALAVLGRLVELQEQTGSVRPEDGAIKWAEEAARIFELLKIEFERQKTNYKESYKRAKKYKPDLTEDEFQKDENITSTINEYCCEKALAQMETSFRSNANLLHLTKSVLLAKPGSSGLKDPETGTRMQCFSGIQPAESDQQLSRYQYWSVAEKAVGSVLDGAILEVDAGTRMGIFRDVPANDEGVSLVIVKCVLGHGLVSGNVFIA